MPRDGSLPLDDDAILESISRQAATKDCTYGSRTIGTAEESTQDVTKTASENGRCGYPEGNSRAKHIQRESRTNNEDSEVGDSVLPLLHGLGLIHLMLLLHRQLLRLTVSRELGPA